MVPELLAERYENAHLRRELLKLQAAQLERLDKDLAAKQTALIEEMRVAVSAEATSLYDVASRTFKAQTGKPLTLAPSPVSSTA